MDSEQTCELLKEAFVIPVMGPKHVRDLQPDGLNLALHLARACSASLSAGTARRVSTTEKGAGVLDRGAHCIEERKPRKRTAASAAHAGGVMPPASSSARQATCHADDGRHLAFEQQALRTVSVHGGAAGLSRSASPNSTSRTLLPTVSSSSTPSATMHLGESQQPSESIWPSPGQELHRLTTVDAGSASFEVVDGHLADIIMLTTYLDTPTASGEGTGPLLETVSEADHKGIYTAPDEPIPTKGYIEIKLAEGAMSWRFWPDGAPEIGSGSNLAMEAGPAADQVAVVANPELRRRSASSGGKKNTAYRGSGCHDRAPGAAVSGWLPSDAAWQQPALPALERLIRAAVTAAQAATAAAAAVDDPAVAQLGPIQLPPDVLQVNPEGFFEPNGALLQGAVLQAACQIIRLAELKGGVRVVVPWGTHGYDVDDIAAAAAPAAASTSPNAGRRIVPFVAVLRLLVAYTGAARALQGAEAAEADGIMANMTAMAKDGAGRMTGESPNLDGGLKSVIAFGASSFDTACTGAINVRSSQAACHTARIEAAVVSSKAKADALEAEVDTGVYQGGHGTSRQHAPVGGYRALWPLMRRGWEGACALMVEVERALTCLPTS